MRISASFIQILCAVVICLVILPSCVIFQPLPLKPAAINDSLSFKSPLRLSDLDGDYRINAADSSRHDLAYALTYFRTYKLNDTAVGNGFVRLHAVSDKRIDAGLFINGKEIKRRKLKGKVRDSYFYFHNNRYSLKIIFLVYEKQSNRLYLSKSHDLYLDTQAGGLGFLIFLPLPLSGATDGDYQLKFQRKN